MQSTMKSDRNRARPPGDPAGRPETRPLHRRRAEPGRQGLVGSPDSGRAGLPGRLRPGHVEPGPGGPVRHPQPPAGRAGRARLLPPGRIWRRPCGRLALPLYSLETKHPLSSVRPDRDLAALRDPLHQHAQRCSIWPASRCGRPTAARTTRSSSRGGHATYNPEPMAEFIDAFAIGEGEEVILEIVDACVRRWKRGGRPRADLHRALARIWGVYVPSCTAPATTPRRDARPGRGVGAPRLRCAVIKRIVAAPAAAA